MAKPQNSRQTNTTPEDSAQPLGPPELSPAVSRRVPQLVHSTKATKVEPVAPAEAELDWLKDYTADAVTEPAEVPAAKPNPVVKAYGEPVAESDKEQLNEHIESPGDPDGVFREQQRQRYSQTGQADEALAAKTKKRHPFLKFLLFVVLLVAATAGVFWFGSYKADQNNKATQQPVSVVTPKKPTTQAETFKQYDSSNFSLSLSYPTAWTLNDTASKLALTSPGTQLQLANGTTKTLHIIFSIQPKQSTIAAYPVNGAVAALASDKLAYSKPSSNQRAQTYLSYLGYGTTNELDALFVTGDSGYQQEQAVPQADLISADPLISVSFVTCTDSACANENTVAQTVIASKWQSTQASKDVTNLIKSIVLD